MVQRERKEKNDGLQELIYQKSAPRTYKLSSAISGNGSWYGDLEYFTKNVLFIMLEESVAQISLALQKKSDLFLPIKIQIQ